jgi:hypothetical protein
MTPDEAKQVPAIVPLEFWIEYVQKNDAKGNPIAEQYEPVEYVRWAKKGSMNPATTEDKVDRVRKHSRAAWSVLEPFYEAWKKGEAEPVNGTPLDVCPFLSPADVKLLKQFHYRSAEDLSIARDSDLQRIGIPGIMQKRGKAIAFLDAKKNEALIVEKMAGVTQENENLKREMAEMKATLEQLSAAQPKRQKPGDVAGRAA